MKNLIKNYYSIPKADNNLINFAIDKSKEKNYFITNLILLLFSIAIFYFIKITWIYMIFSINFIFSWSFLYSLCIWFIIWLIVFIKNNFVIILFTSLVVYLLILKNKLSS